LVYSTDTTGDKEMIVPKSWYVSAVLGLTLVLTAFGWNDTYKALQNERSAHAQTIQTFNTAQTEANKKAEAKRKELQAKADEASKQSNATYNDLYSKYRATLLRFKANQGGGQRPNSGERKAAQGSAGPGGGADVLNGQTDEVIISLGDAGICAVNTARLQAVRDWALKLPH
jgi:hypothetical protein